MSPAKTLTMVAAAALLLGAAYTVAPAPAGDAPAASGPATRPVGLAGGPYRNDWPTDHYTLREVEGWKVYVHKPLLAGPDPVGERFCLYLRSRLLEVKLRLPARAVKTLQTIPFWVEDRDSDTAACYHWSAERLKADGFNPDKARGVHICSASKVMHYGRWQPGTILHELAHGYHQRVRDKWGPQIRGAWKAAIEAGRYKAVSRVTDPGRRVEAYAARNPMEYFAEATEAYFLLNDFYPHFWAQLEAYDPAMYKLLGTIYGVEKPLHYTPPKPRGVR